MVSADGVLKMSIAPVYAPLTNDLAVLHYRLGLLYSGRSSGKSTFLSQLMYIYFINFPDYDICIGVDSVTNAGDGLFAEFRSFIENNGLNESGEWDFGKQVITNKYQKNQIRAYAVQTNELRNVNATKSKKLIRNVSLFIMDEVQKLHSLEILLNAKSTFMRQLKAGHSKVIFAGNPDRSAMWFHDYYKACLKDPEYTVICSTYMDIIDSLHPALLHEIEQLKKTDTIAYRQIYLGDLDAAGWETVFHSFIESKCYIDRRALLQTDERLGFGGYINSIIIGVDDAESQDAIAATMVTVHNNGMLRAQESFYLSCKEQSIKPALTERCELIVKFLDYVHEHFNPERTIPIIFSFDCASGMYRQMSVMLRTDKNYMRWRNVRLFPYTTKREKTEQLDMVNAAFANGVLTVVNVDKFSPQYSNKHLVRQIKELRYLENKKIDPTIPNDCTDALQYAVMMVLNNPFNLTFPQRKERYDRDRSIDTVLEKIQAQDEYGRI